MTSSKYKPYQHEAWNKNKQLERTTTPSMSRSVRQVPVSTTRTSTTTLKNIWTTLNDPTNPITHPIRRQADHVDSCITGHQRSDGRVPRVVVKSRIQKLREQRIERGRKENGILAGTRIYITGYLVGTTDLEIKRHVVLEGGEILTSANGATHIITSRGLSTAKMQKHLHSNRINHPYVITPQWVTESIKAGKRKVEREYAALETCTEQ